MAVEKISKVKNIDSKVKIFFFNFHIPSGHMLPSISQLIKDWEGHTTHKLVKMTWFSKKNSQCKIEIKAEIDLM